jgi:hypothetical protein
MHKVSRRQSVPSNMESSAPVVSGRWVAIVIAVVILIAVTVACVWMYRDYLSAPRQP